MSKNKKAKYIHVEVNENGVFVSFGYAPNTPVYTKKVLDECCVVAGSVMPKTGVRFAVVKPVDILVEI